VEPGDIKAAETALDRVTQDGWPAYQVDGLPVGLWAKDILVNNYVVGDYNLIPDHHKLGLVHMRNLLILKTAYGRLLDDLKPDRIVANDSYYGMWAILQKLSEKRGIAFYSHWMGTRQGGWCYAQNDAAMNLDFSISWGNFSKKVLNDRQKEKVEKWLEGRLTGKEMILDTASLGDHQNVGFDAGKLDGKKPTALLAANVIWDLAALNKQVVFNDMIDWIAETIEWFRNRPEFQLIIKPHPAELNPSIPETTERVEIALAARDVAFPENVFLLSPKVNFTVYQLSSLATAVLVHTTTVGIEMAARGIPVITTARAPYSGFGFTIDPVSRGKYFRILERTLQGCSPMDTAVQKDLAYKFILFFHFHYYMKVGIMDYMWGEVPRLKLGSIRELLPGKNIYLDYVTDSIMGGLPILSETRWPPES
jgi:hypothetical protein